MQIMSRADSRLVPNQWETSLLSNAVSHWLGANLESASMSHNSRCYTSMIFLTCNLRPFSFYGWARSQPMKENVAHGTSSLIGWELAQWLIEHVPSVIADSVNPVDVVKRLTLFFISYCYSFSWVQFHNTCVVHFILCCVTCYWRCS